MVNYLFIGLLIAAAIHIFEEYIFPGGFTAAFSNLIPSASHLFTVNFHIVVNGVFILICILATIIGKANLIISFSAFGLIFTNAILHIRGAIVQKGYYPGVLSAIFIYIPMAIYAFLYMITSKQLTWVQAGLSFLMGVMYMGALMVYVLLQQRGNKTEL
jgi:hypothetical protein